MAKTLCKTIYFDQCDPAGILYFANIFKVAHHSYEDLLKDIQFDLFSHEEFAFPIIDCKAQFSNPVQMGEVQIEVSCGQIGHSSYELTYQIKQDQKACATVTTKHVTIDKKENRSISIPTRLKSWLETELSE